MLDPYVPERTPAPAPRSRGGAPRGNLNALKHGLYSPRLQATRHAADAPARDEPLPLDAVQIARRLHAEQRRELARLTSSLARVALTAQFHRESEEAVATGRPLPEPPILRLRRRDILRLIDFIRDSAARAGREHERAAGLLGLDHPEIAAGRDERVMLDKLIRLSAVTLDRAVARPLLDARLLDLLRLTTEGNNPPDTPQSESATPKQPRNLNPAEKTAQDNKQPPPTKEQAGIAATRVSPLRAGEGSGVRSRSPLTPSRHRAYPEGKIPRQPPIAGASHQPEAVVHRHA